MQGQVVLEQLRAQIGEENVYDLVADRGPQRGLQENKDVKNLRIIGKTTSDIRKVNMSLDGSNLFDLACGGDGTVGWVLSALDVSQMQFMDLVSVGVIPLGTGNDMARFLGWGVGYRGEQLNPIVQSLSNSQSCLLDRWQIDVQPTAHTGIASLKVYPNDMITSTLNENMNYFEIFLHTDSTTCLQQLFELRR